jgi:DNA-binding CsgD family transcriptional regulator
LWSGDSRAVEGFRRRRELSLSRGATTTVAIGLSSEIHLLLELGRTEEAAIMMQRAVAIAQYETPLGAAMASLGEARFLAYTDSSSGHRVLSLVDQAESILDEVGFGFGRIESQAIRIAELARTDIGAAATRSIECLDRYDAAGMGDPGLMQGLLDSVEALIATSHPHSERLLVLLDKVDTKRTDLASAQRWRNCCIEALTGPSHEVEGLDALHVDWLAVGNVFWAARALVLGARVKRRAGQRRESADRFARAHELFGRIGATAWATTVSTESARNGRPRSEARSNGEGASAKGRAHAQSVTALTGNELRVAQLAASGATNRDIAQAMFVSEKTVEAALTAVYRKLSIARRSQLHLALGSAD